MSLREILDYWEGREVELIAHEGGGIITLSKIRVPRDIQNHGTGTRAVKDLTDYADATGQLIAATPSLDFGATSLTRLADFYRRLGFVKNAGRHKDFRTRETMIREPQPMKNPVQKNPWLEYRLDRLTFAGGEAQLFPPNARLLYNPEDNIIAIELTTAQRHRIVDSIRHGGPAVNRELRRIEYSMLVELPGARPRTLRFFHPLKSGSGVRLAVNDRGELFFLNESGRPLFSKDYTLRDVSRGKIDSDRAVWQFHGYRHEH